jgi:hypothetical protein
MEWLPLLSFEVLKVAFPDPSTVMVAILVAPSRNVTTPDGVPLEELTSALKVTSWLTVDGSGLDVKATVVGSFTPCEIEALLLAQFESPEYKAVIVAHPAGSVEVP